MTAALVSGGRATHQIEPALERETGQSQVFIAFALPAHDGGELAARLADEIVDSVKGGGGDGVRYPGERTLETRRENTERGVPVEPSIWEQVRAL